MSIAGIEKVREAEIAADKLRKEADDRAAAIVAEGRKEAEKIGEQAEKEAEEKYKTVIARAAEEADKIYDEKIAFERKVCEDIKAGGRERVDEAVGAIIRRVVNSDGNS